MMKAFKFYSRENRREFIDRLSIGIEISFKKAWDYLQDQEDDTSLKAGVSLDSELYYALEKAKGHNNGMLSRRQQKNILIDALELRAQMYRICLADRAHTSDIVEFLKDRITRLKSFDTRNQTLYNCLNR